jgi:SAM-dependent MidA family methyltransferase
MMPTVETLPPPDQVAKQRSDALSARILRACQQQGGSIAFSDYMRMALYEPVNGYYSSGSPILGQAGDFITAPEVSPLFSRCIARQISQVFQQTAVARVLEFGAGSGVMAVDILLELERLRALPDNYAIIELSAELRERQQRTIRERAAHLFTRVSWLDDLPRASIGAVVVANEVLDAMPVECFRINHDSVERLRIVAQNDRLRMVYTEADEAFVEQVRAIERRRGKAFAHGYCSEFNPMLQAWLASLHALLSEGLVLLIDYGYPVSEYYLDERDSGTLICHYRHRAHADPLWYPGLQDITAFVDFSAVADAAVDLGFEVGGFASQAMFLMGCGLADYYQAEVNDDPRQQLVLSQQIKTLTLPSEMGERFKAMALTSNVDLPLIGFALQDLSNRL